MAPVDAVDLKCDDEARWTYALDSAAVIDAHWQAAREANPKLFNGPVLMMHAAQVRGGVLVGRFLRTDFKSFLYWRDQGSPPAAGVIDAFGSALVWSGDGRLMFARQSEGHINSGLLYMPGGFIDARDVRDDGRVDIVGSVARELMEETGLGAVDLERIAGFSVTVNGACQLSIGVPYRSGLPADALRARVLAFIAGEDDPELADVVFRASAEPDPRYPFAPYAELLATAVLEAGAG